MAKAQDEPSLRMYSELGVQFVDPGGSEYYWQTAGWEDVPHYPSDIIRGSTSGWITPPRPPTWRSWPAG